MNYYKAKKKDTENLRTMEQMTVTYNSKQRITRKLICVRYSNLLGSLSFKK